MMVGDRLTAGMSDELLNEFGYFVDGDEDGMTGWLAEHCPGFEQDKAFVGLAEANPDAPRAAVMSEYGAMKWLRLNKPEYPQVVVQTADTLMDALRSLVTDLGEDAFETWARVYHGWAQIMDQASCSHEVIVGLAALISHEGAPALECWASVEQSLAGLNERAEAIAESDAIAQDGAR